MNSLIDRYSKSSATVEIRRAKEMLEEEDGMDAMWGSQAGFATVASGLPKFTIPAVPDVSYWVTCSIPITELTYVM